MKQYVYADNAATTQVDKNAVDAMMPFLLMNTAMRLSPMLFPEQLKKHCRRPGR